MKDTIQQKGRFVSELAENMTQPAREKALEMKQGAKEAWAVTKEKGEELSQGASDKIKDVRQGANQAWEKGKM
jgi:hypothetical protein